MPKPTVLEHTTALLTQAKADIIRKDKQLLMQSAALRDRDKSLATMIDIEGNQRAALNKASERIAELEAGLMFYADKKNYVAADPYSADGEFRAWGKQRNFVPDDEGERARALLSKEPK